MSLILLLILSKPRALIPTAVHKESGRLSVYWPNDSMCTGRVMARVSPSKRAFYKRGSVHLAHRRWLRWGCGRRVVVCSNQTKKCAVAPILDSGPWGIYRGRFRNAKAEGRWRRPRTPREAHRWLRRLPKGWKFRGVADLSYALWVKLGKPRGFSRIRLYFLHRTKKVACSRSLSRGQAFASR